MSDYPEPFKNGDQTVPTLPHQSPFGNPCVEGCPICDDEAAEQLATHLGLADESDPAIEADARAADSIRWGLWSPDLPRTYRDEDGPDELAEAWEPAPEDREWWAAESVEGCGIDELSPEEQECELYGESEWVAACKEHARWMEEQEQENAYHEMIGRLTMGGFPVDL